MFGFWSWAANFTWSMRLLTVSSFAVRSARPRRTVTTFSRPAALSFAARYSVPSPEVSTSSRSTNFPNFSLLGMEGALQLGSGLAFRARVGVENSTRPALFQRDGGWAGPTGRDRIAP